MRWKKFEAFVIVLQSFLVVYPMSSESSPTYETQEDMNLLFCCQSSSSCFTWAFQKKCLAIHDTLSSLNLYTSL
jgi:hypothetical protein